MGGYSQTVRELHRELVRARAAADTWQDEARAELDEEFFGPLDRAIALTIEAMDAASRHLEKSFAERSESA